MRSFDRLGLFSEPRSGFERPADRHASINGDGGMEIERDVLVA
jgi:hypothetical protein